MSKIKKAREAAKMSREKMCELLKIPVKTIEKWENGEDCLPEWEENMILENIMRVKDTYKNYPKDITVNVLGKGECSIPGLQIEQMFDDDITGSFISPYVWAIPYDKFEPVGFMLVSNIDIYVAHHMGKDDKVYPYKTDRDDYDFYKIEGKNFIKHVAVFKGGQFREFGYARFGSLADIALYMLSIKKDMMWSDGKVTFSSEQLVKISDKYPKPLIMDLMKYEITTENKKVIMKSIGSVDHFEYVKRYARKMMEIAREKVRLGKSKVLNDWRRVVPAVKDEDFLENLEWVYNDTGKVHTREIALTNEGEIKKIYIHRDSLGLVTRVDDDGKRWEGSHFRVPVPKGKEMFADRKDGKYGVILNICLNKDSEI